MKPSDNPEIDAKLADELKRFGEYAVRYYV